MKFTDGKNDYKDNYVPYAPVNTIFGSAAYNHNIGKWNLEYNLRCRGVGRIYWNEENDARQPMYALLGASFTAPLLQRVSLHFVRIELCAAWQSQDLRPDRQV